MLGPESASTSGDVVLLIMKNMGWRPGQTLGLNKRGLRVPLVGRLTDRKEKEGLGYSRTKFKEIQVLEQLVDVLKLKIQEEMGETAKHPIVKSVFEEETEGENHVDYKCTVALQVYNHEVLGLVDTGSDLTCISGEFWEMLRRHCDVPLMPIKPFHIKTAVGHKSVEIRNIVLLPIALGPVMLDVGCVIVPGLVNQIILGFDWLKMNQVTISLEKEKRGLLIKNNGKVNLIEFFDQGLEVNHNNVIEVRNDKEELEKLLKKYEKLFVPKLGRANCYQHRILMETQVPIIKRTYPIPYAYREKIGEKLREMEEQGIISRTCTPYCSPLTFTLKKDGTIRVLLDARELNKYMIPETEKPPLQLDVMNAFHGVNYISVIDLNNAYFQIPISEGSKKYTGFSFNGKSYVYNVLPQGLKTSVGSFSRAMDIILGHEVREFCVNYLDDLAVITPGTLEEHISHVDVVLSKLEKAGLTCNLNKCKFLTQEVKMLGYVITTRGISTDPDKVKAIREFPAPMKLKQLRAFLGLCNFYRRFIPGYSVHIQPLCSLLKKEKEWKWGEEEIKAFEKVKELFIRTIQLHHPDVSKPYYLQTDASGVGLAGVLYQQDEEGGIKIIGFHSKALKGAELNWTVTEQEFYSVISCLTKFETYLRGSRVIIKTDHKALIFVKTWRLYNARVTRWVNYLENFHYEIFHVKGKENIVPDILSRYPPESDRTQEDKLVMPKIMYMRVVENDNLNERLRDLSRLQKNDPELHKLIERVGQKSGGNSKINRIAERCEIKDEILYYKPVTSLGKVLVLPEELREDVIKQVHREMGHQGQYKVIKYIRDRFYWRGLTRQVKRVIRKCHDCQMTKNETVKRVGPCQPIVTNDIGELVMVDLYGPLPTGLFGMNYILVLQDSFSKFIKLYELRKATSNAVLGRVRKFFELIKPKAIMSDNGSQFTSRIWNETMQQEGVKVIHTTVRNPRPNTTERVNRELGRLFRTYCRTNHRGWVTVLPRIEELYNNTFHESTKYTPCEVMYGHPTRLSIDANINYEETRVDIEGIREAVRANLRKSGENRRVKFDQRYRLVQFQIGDFVKIRRLNKSDAKQKITRKFESLYEGPYVIARNPYKNVYILVDPKTNKERGKFNTIHLARYYK